MREFRTCIDCGKTQQLELFPIKKSGTGPYRSTKCQRCFDKFGRVRPNRLTPASGWRGPVLNTYMEGGAMVMVLPASAGLTG